MAVRKSGYVVAREAIIVNVGAKPAVYREINVVNRRTGEPARILDTDNDPVEPEDPGTPYAFKSYQKIPKDHPAVKECPGAFLALEDVDEELVSA
jgi:hypothetical protein